MTNDFYCDEALSGRTPVDMELSGFQTFALSRWAWKSFEIKWPIRFPATVTVAHAAAVTEGKDHACSFCST
jgi:hypothetical protein